MRITGNTIFVPGATGGIGLALTLALRERGNTVTTNVLGPIRLIAAFLPHLQAQPTATVITVSSGLAFTQLRITPEYNAAEAAIRMLTETLRLEFHDSPVEFKELQPPSVKTDLLPGQRDSDFAMPPDDFIAEVIEILDDDPDAREIQVENVKLLRYPKRGRTTPRPWR